MTARLIPLLLVILTASGESVRPGVIAKEDLEEYPALAGPRKRIVEEALDLAANETWLRYTFGSADPANGGLDCSGTVHFILRRAGLSPPRTSAGQFTWVKSGGVLTEVSATVTSTGAAAFSKLQPGDLLFWSGTYEPKDGREVTVSHVQIFLGHEKSGGAPVMIGASDGRTYRGTKREGYGVYDFKLPKPGSKGRFLGYGLPLRAP